MKLALYKYNTCPFCLITMRAISQSGLDVEMRDILLDASLRDELIEHGGKAQVPCLRIEDEHGDVVWLYESREIINYIGELSGTE